MAKKSKRGSAGAYKTKTDRLHKDFGGIVDSLKGTFDDISKGFGDMVGKVDTAKPDIPQPEVPKAEPMPQPTDKVEKTAAAQIEPVKLDMAEDSLTQPVEVHSVENFMSGQSLPKAAAYGGSIVPTKLPIGSDDPNDFFQKLINYSFAVTRLYDQKGPPIAPHHRYERPYADGGRLKKIQEALDTANQIVGFGSKLAHAFKPSQSAQPSTPAAPAPADIAKAPEQTSAPAPDATAKPEVPTPDMSSNMPAAQTPDTSSAGGIGDSISSGIGDMLGGIGGGFAYGGHVLEDDYPTHYLPHVGRQVMADGGDPDASRDAFLREQLKGSAPQYVAENDMPARVARGIEIADKYAGGLNNLLANIAGVKEMRSPEGRGAMEIVQSALPADPYKAAGEAGRQINEGDRLGAVETMLAGLPMQGAIRAYHGSPHKFDKFDISKIGTGEGAQAYGHGLYFAGNENVAKSYKELLAKPRYIYEGSDYGNPSGYGSDARARILDDMRRLSKQTALQNIEDNIRFNEKYAPSIADMQRSYLDWAKSIDPAKIDVQSPGHMYEVDIHADPSHMLDWDKPLSEQHPNVINSISDVVRAAKEDAANPFSLSGNFQGSRSTEYGNPEKYKDLSGAALHDMISRVYGHEMQSNELRNRGIPGIRYLDAASRGAGEGTSNYVVFDPNIIDILRRYAKGGSVNMADGGISGEVSYAQDDAIPNLPTFARENPQESIRQALETAQSIPVKKKEYEPFGVLPLKEDEAGIHFDPYAGVLGSVTRPAKYFYETMSGQKEMEPTSEEAIRNAMDLAGAVTLGSGAFERPAGALAAGASRPAQEAVEIARNLSPLGFYSHAAEAARALPQEKGTYEQMMAMLNKAGVKPEELHWSNVQQLAGQPVTREQLAQHFESNLPEIKETVLSSYQNPYSYRTADEWQAAINRAERAGNFDEAERLTNAWEHFEGYGAAGAGGSAKFQQYTIPGGENYREVLLRLPNKPLGEEEARKVLGAKPDAVLSQADIDYATRKAANEYQSSHWDEPNVLGHLRMSDRTTPEGEKILHLEELQSDWGQAGRKQGFRNEENLKLKNDISDQIHEMKRNLLSKSNQLTDDWVNKKISVDEMNAANRALYADYNPKIKALQEEYDAIPKSGDLPSAPYVASPEGKHTSSWVDLGLKRALREAAEGGYNKLVWTPGAEQASRYDLSKHIDELHWHRGNLVAYDKDGNKVIQRTGMSASELPDVVGKDVADKLLAQEAGSDGWRSLEGQDLSVGGEGMKSFYDKIVPSQLRKIVDKLDKSAKIELGGHSISSDGNEIKAHSIQITPKMREAILKGLPAYASGGSADSSIEAAFNVISKLPKH